MAGELVKVRDDGLSRRLRKRSLISFAVAEPYGPELAGITPTGVSQAYRQHSQPAYPAGPHNPLILFFIHALFIQKIIN